MKKSDNPFTYVNLRLIAAALVAILVFAPGAVLSADKPSPSADKPSRVDRVEMRIKDMHAKLKITPAQEEQWGKVAMVMREDAKTMDAMTQARMTHAKDMSAVDDLKSYSEIVDAHAAGIRKLTPAFASLYASMSDKQKMSADALFRQGGLVRGQHKPRDKMKKEK
jgi:protein CpxP